MSRVSDCHTRNTMHIAGPRAVVRRRRNGLGLLPRATNPRRSTAPSAAGAASEITARARPPRSRRPPRNLVMPNRAKPSQTESNRRVPPDRGNARTTSATMYGTDEALLAMDGTRGGDELSHRDPPQVRVAMGLYQQITASASQPGRRAHLRTRLHCSRLCSRPLTRSNSR